MLPRRGFVETEIAAGGHKRRGLLFIMLFILAPLQPGELALFGVLVFLRQKLFEGLDLLVDI